MSNGICSGISYGNCCQQEIFNISGGSSNTVVEQRGASVRGLPPSITDTSKTRKTAGLYLKHILKSLRAPGPTAFVKVTRIVGGMGSKEKEYSYDEVRTDDSTLKRTGEFVSGAGGFHFSFVVGEVASRP